MALKEVDEDEYNALVANNAQTGRENNRLNHVLKNVLPGLLDKVPAGNLDALPGDTKADIAAKALIAKKKAEKAQSEKEQAEAKRQAMVAKQAELEALAQ